MVKPGKYNTITDVAGLSVGNAEHDKAMTGVTVLRCAEQFVAAVDVRGGAPGVRETETLASENLVGRADAIVLTGGSVFGLAAAESVSWSLSQNQIGLELIGNTRTIPIVPAAVLYDLGHGGDKFWDDEPPYRTLGEQALKAAAKSFKMGAVGAGRGATAGRVAGGLGSTSIIVTNNVAVGALVAVNSVGSVYLADGESFYAWPWEVEEEFGGRPPPKIKDEITPIPSASRLSAAQPGSNTTIAVVATSANLTNVEAKRVAIMAQDGIARAIRPAHTPFDGDIVFAVATAKHELAHQSSQMRTVQVAEIGAAAADCLARAIARGVYEAAR